MGMVTASFKSEEIKKRALTVDLLSTATVSVMEALGKDEDIFKLMYYGHENALGVDLSADPVGNRIFSNGEHYKHGNVNQKIEPYPLSPELQVSHECFIRCYFNQGSVLRENNHWSTNQMNIDIICSHGLWLTADRTDKLKIVRPYAIMSRVYDLLQLTEKDLNKLPQPSGYQQFTVNETFECLRVYANLDNVEMEHLNK